MVGGFPLVFPTCNKEIYWMDTDVLTFMPEALWHIADCFYWKYNVAVMYAKTNPNGNEVFHMQLENGCNNL